MWLGMLLTVVSVLTYFLGVLLSRGSPGGVGGFVISAVVSAVFLAVLGVKYTKVHKGMVFPVIVAVVFLLSVFGLFSDSGSPYDDNPCLATGGVCRPAGEGCNAFPEPHFVDDVHRCAGDGQVCCRPL